MPTIETTQNKTGDHKPSICQPSCFGKTGELRFGVILVAIGLIWLSARTGLLPVEWFHSEFFWPVVLTLIGFWIIVKSIIRRERHRRAN